MDSYLIHTFRTFEEPNAVVNKYVGDLSKEERRLFVHILYCGQLNAWEDYWVPVPFKTMKQFLGASFTYTNLIDRGLIEIKSLADGEEYSKQHRLCREFRVVELVIEEFNQAHPSTLEESVGLQHYNVVTGYKLNTKQDSKRTDSTKHSVPDLQRRSLELIKRTLIKENGLLKHLDNQQRAIEDSRTESERQLNIKRHRIDQTAYNSIKVKVIEKVDEEVFAYAPVYEPLSTGRIIEKGIGIQPVQEK